MFYAHFHLCINKLLYHHLYCATLGEVEAEKHQVMGGPVALAHSQELLWFTSILRLNMPFIQMGQHAAYRRGSLLWNVRVHTKFNTYTYTQAVVVMDGRPQSVGRQPVSQNEAQSNHSEMNALEDSQTTTSNTQSVRGKRH